MGELRQARPRQAGSHVSSVALVTGGHGANPPLGRAPGHPPWTAAPRWSSLLALRHPAGEPLSTDRHRDQERTSGDGRGDQAAQLRPTETDRQPRTAADPQLKT